MRIIIEIDAAGSDGVRVENASTPASAAVSTNTATAAVGTQMAATNAGPAPAPGGHGANAMSDMLAADSHAAAHKAGISAGAAPGMA